MEEQINAKNASMDEEQQFFAKALPNGVIPCATWDLESDPDRLPSLPRLPPLSSTGDEVVDEVKILKIAAMDGRILALTNQGHVLMFFGLENETTISGGRWQYASTLAHSVISAYTEYAASELQRARTSPILAALHAYRRDLGRRASQDDEDHSCEPIY
jgi:hypothetical protein